jgi:hypothetical protein
MANRVPLTLACWDYDRTSALASGDVRPEGVIVLRRDVYAARPWLARSLFKAFEEARRAAAERLAETAASRSMQPDHRAGRAVRTGNHRRLRDLVGARTTRRGRSRRAPGHPIEAQSHE